MADEIKKDLKDVENSIVIAPDYTINDIGCNQDSINKINSNFAKLNYSLLESVEVYEFQLIFKFKDGASSPLDLPFDENTVIGIEVNDDDSGYTITKLNGDKYDVPALYPNCVVLIELSEDQTKYIFTYADKTTFEIPVPSGGGSTTYNLLTDVVTNDSYIPVWTDNQNNHVIKTNKSDLEIEIGYNLNQMYYDETDNSFSNANETVNNICFGCYDFVDMLNDNFTSVESERKITINKTGAYKILANDLVFEFQGFQGVGGAPDPQLIITAGGIAINRVKTELVRSEAGDRVLFSAGDDDLILNLKENDEIEYYFEFDDQEINDEDLFVCDGIGVTFPTKYVYQNFIIDQSHLPTQSSGSFKGTLIFSNTFSFGMNDSTENLTLNFYESDEFYYVECYMISANDGGVGNYTFANFKGVGDASTALITDSFDDSLVPDFMIQGSSVVHSGINTGYFFIAQLIKSGGSIGIDIGGSNTSRYTYPTSKIMIYGHIPKTIGGWS